MSIRIRKLVWDTWNIKHIARHDISPEDIEWLLTCARPRPCFERSRSEKLAVWGRDEHGRFLLLILANRGKCVYYPVTARTMTEREKRRYQRFST